MGKGVGLGTTSEQHIVSKRLGGGRESTGDWPNGYIPMWRHGDRMGGAAYLMQVAIVSLEDYAAEIVLDMQAVAVVN